MQRENQQNPTQNLKKLHIKAEFFWYFIPFNLTKTVVNKTTIGIYIVKRS